MNASKTMLKNVKLRIRFDKMDLIVSMDFHSTLKDLKTLLMNQYPQLQALKNLWDLKSPLGADRIYQDDMTHAECGWVPSARLFIQIRK